MNTRITNIRKREEEYHLSCYEQHRLFESGSWLHKPVKTVMDLVNELDAIDCPRVLDLGCGVGRNSIPIAERMKKQNGTVICVDLLQPALDKLMEYSEKHGVAEMIEPVAADIGQFEITSNTYDLIVAVSSIEHVASVDELDRVLHQMAEGTRKNGFICLILSTNIEETDLVTSERLDPSFEVNMPTDTMLNKLNKIYSGWTERKVTVKSQQYEIDREGRPVLLKGDVLTYVVQK